MLCIQCWVEDFLLPPLYHEILEVNEETCVINARKERINTFFNDNFASVFALNAMFLIVVIRDIIISF